MGYRSTKQVSVRGRVFGDGRMLLCVPILGRTKEEISEQVSVAVSFQPDLLEWRADYFNDVSRDDALDETLALVRRLAGDLPVIFTLRHPEEGGAAAFLREEKQRIITRAAQSGTIDLVDIEMRYGEEYIDAIRRVLQEQGVSLILSYHNNRWIESDAEILERLRAGERLGADIVKVSMTATDFHGLNRMMQTICRAKREGVIHRPIISTSGGVIGGVARLLGEYYGSDMTFVSAAGASDAGQMHISDYRDVLGLIRQDDE